MMLIFKRQRTEQNFNDPKGLSKSLCFESGESHIRRWQMVVSKIRTRTEAANTHNSQL